MVVLQHILSLRSREVSDVDEDLPRPSGFKRQFQDTEMSGDEPQQYPHPVFIDRRSMPPQDPQGWHIDKKVPVSTILAILSMSLTGMWGFADLKKDVALIQANAIVLRDHDLKLEVDTHEAIVTIRDQYRDLNAKIDRVIERLPRP